MSKPLKPRRGTTAENNAFVGEAFEVTYDTDKNTLVCRDGLTAGGFPLARADEVAQKDAQQDAAISAAQSSADAASGKVTTLDSTLRDLIAEEVAKCFKRSGGQLNGNVHFSQESVILYKDTNTGSFVIRGGTSSFPDGASLYLYGVGSSNQGQFRLYAHDGTASTALIGYTDGLLEWNNDKVLTGEDVFVRGESTTTKTKLPSGGTWAVFNQYHYGNAIASRWAGVVSGGSTINTSANFDYAQCIAIRIA